MPTINFRNKFDKKDSLELGEHADNLFIVLAVKLGWKVSAATKNENINKHWDYLIEMKSDAFKVEVKSRKRISRSDDRLRTDLTWVEIHGVRSQDAGWLFGKADLVAFEKEKSFFS